MRHRTVVARASRPVPVYSVTETWRRHRRGCFAVAPAFGVRRLVAAVFRERKPPRCGSARAASKSANKLAHSKRCCERQTRTFTPYLSCPQCAKHIPHRMGEGESSPVGWPIHPPRKRRNYTRTTVLGKRRQWAKSTKTNWPQE